MLQNWCKSHDLAFSRSIFSQNIAQPSLIFLDYESTLSVLPLNKKNETWSFCSMEKKFQKVQLSLWKKAWKSRFSQWILTFSKLVQLMNWLFKFVLRYTFEQNFMKIGRGIFLSRSTCQRLLLVIDL